MSGAVENNDDFLENILEIKDKNERVKILQGIEKLKSQ